MRSTLWKRGLLSAITFTLWFGLNVYSPFMTPYLRSLSITATMTGVIVGAYGIAQIAMRVSLGIAADLVQKHRFFVMLGTLSVCVASALRFFFVSPVTLFFANVLSGIGASTWVSYTILNTMYYAPEDMSRSIGLLNAFNSGGGLMGFLVSGVIYQAFGMRALFFTSMLVGGIGTVLAFFIEDEPRVETTVTLPDCIRAMLKPRILAFSLLLICFEIITFSTSNSFASNLFADLGFSSTKLSFCSAMFMLSSTLSSVLVSLPSVRKIPEQLLLFLCFAILGVYCLLLSFCRTFAGCVFVQLFGGLGCSSIFTLLQGNALKDVPARYHSSAMGFAQTLYSIGILTGPIIMGKLVDTFTLLPAIRLICIPAFFGCIAAPVFYLCFEKKKKQV